MRLIKASEDHLQRYPSRDHPAYSLARFESLLTTLFDAISKLQSHGNPNYVPGLMSYWRLRDWLETVWSRNAFWTPTRGKTDMLKSILFDLGGPVVESPDPEPTPERMLELLARLPDEITLSAKPKPGDPPRVVSVKKVRAELRKQATSREPTTPPPPASGIEADSQPAAEPTSPAPVVVPERLMTLGQAAALVNRSPRTLERYKKKGMPKPLVYGGGGNAHEYPWLAMREWLQKTFNRPIPDVSIERFRHPKAH
jgi:hypothetical protein